MSNTDKYFEPSAALPEFRPWSTIKKFTGVRVQITEKIHGTNAQIHVFPDSSGNLQILAGKRTAYVDSNSHFGFGRFVHDNATALIASLGFGRHYGEWVGPGIGASYNLKEKQFVLFNPLRYDALFEKTGIPLPPRVCTVPLLYDGEYSREAVDYHLGMLRSKGSRFAPGWMHPEGIVLYFPESDQTRKCVFDPEETAWNQKTDAEKAEKINLAVIVAPYLQPTRLEKLLMRDEKYLAAFPKTMPLIVRDYVADLVSENPELDPALQEAVRRACSKFIFAETSAFRERIANPTT